MKFLIAYGSTDGQTRKIARFCTDWLSIAGHTVELFNVKDAGPTDVGRFDAVLLAGSVHTGKYQKALEDFVHETLPALRKRPSLFLSVSLAAAGEDPEDRAGLDDCVSRFTKATGWQPDRVEHVAGAFKFAEYDFFRYWAMRWIASQKAQDVDPHADCEYTDWEALRAILADWTAGLSAAA